MKILVNCCDECRSIGEKLRLTPYKDRELCIKCVSEAQYKRSQEIQEINRQNAKNLSSCDKCKHTGILHKSMYVLGPGYGDPPDPTVYCKCPKGHALNPFTNFIVKEDIFI